MKFKYLSLLLPIFIFIGCSKTSTAAPDCTALGVAVTNASSAYLACTGEDCATACADNVTAYQAAVDAGCTGYTVEGVAAFQAACDASGGG